MTKAVSIIVVNFNGLNYMAPFLETIRDQDFRDFEFIMVDNGSQDGSQDLAKKFFPDAEVVLNTDNRGFCAAMNQGIALARAPFILAQNFDCLLAPDFLGRVLEAMERDPGYGSACGKIFRMTKSLEKTELMDSAGHHFLERWPGRRGWDTPDTGAYDAPAVVFGAPGSSALYRRAMLDDIAFRGEVYDENLFMYLDDIDIDWRANIFGWRCIYTPDATAWHATMGALDTQSAKKRSRIEHLYLVNRRLLTVKNDEWGKAMNAFPTMLWKTVRPYKKKEKVWEFDPIRFWRCLPNTLSKRSFNNSRRKVSFQDMEFWYENDARPVSD